MHVGVSPRQKLSHSLSVCRPDAGYFYRGIGNCCRQKHRHSFSHKFAAFTWANCEISKLQVRFMAQNHVTPLGKSWLSVPPTSFHCHRHLLPICLCDYLLFVCALDSRLEMLRCFRLTQVENRSMTVPNEKRS